MIWKWEEGHSILTNQVKLTNIRTNPVLRKNLTNLFWEVVSIKIPTEKKDKILLVIPALNQIS